jgi:hypothetical protein
MSDVFKVCAKSFRRMDDPLDRDDKKKYVAYVHVKDVPQGIPMATNPREQNLKTNVAKAIEESLLTNDGNFHLLNRGLVLSAQHVEYDNRKEVMTITFDNPVEHGNIDGGHTYKTILKHKDRDLDQYVTFEIMTDVEDIIEPLASARNTSAQVDDKSLAELEGKFDPIKDSIGGMPFFGRVAFKQNQHAGQGVKVIDAREVVAILTMFNVDKYTATEHPIIAYSSKAKILENYLADQSEFEKMHNIAPDVFDLYCAIEKDFPYAYNASGGRYGLKKYSGYKEGAKIGSLKFGTEDDVIEYKVPEGLLYPALGAFRALIEIDEATGMYRWKKNPFKVYEKIREQLASKIVKFSDSVGNNPMSVGKDSNSWDILYMTVERSA